MEKCLELLLSAVAGKERVLILPHNDPDPDAIAGAVALRHLLAQAAGLPSEIVYRGMIGRAENKALIDPRNREAQRLLLRLRSA